MAGGSDVEIGHYQPEDEQLVNDLHNSVFNTSRPLEAWRWKYLLNPATLTGPTCIVLGRSQGRIVSQYASVARDLLINGKTSPITEVTDNLIDPDFRSGRQLQRGMFDYFSAKLIEAGAHFSIGCPNDVAYRVGKRLLQYRDLFEMPWLFHRLGPRLALRSRLPAAWGTLADRVGRTASAWSRWSLRARGACRVREVEAPDARFDALWRAAAGRFAVIGVRDRAYLHWRYRERPGTRFYLLSAGDDALLTAWVVVSVATKADGSRAGYIVDFFYRDETAMRKLLLGALHYLAELDADYVLSVAAPGSEGERLLRSVGFAARPTLGPVRLVYRWWTLQDEVMRAAVLDPSGWHLCMGDLDLEG